MSCTAILIKVMKPSTNLMLHRILVNSVAQHSTSGSGSKDTSSPKKDKKTPKGRLDDEYDEAPKSYNEKEPLKPWPDNTNPNTGEYNGPKGPEPTRYGDWERKGRCIDF